MQKLKRALSGKAKDKNPRRPSVEVNREDDPGMREPEAVNQVDITSDNEGDTTPKQELPEGFSNFSHSVILPGAVMDNRDILDDEEIGLATLLAEAKQGHLFKNWPMPGTDDDKKHQFFKQVKLLHETYPAEGGLMTYVERARKLLADAQEGTNPLDGWSPSVPTGEALEPGTEKYAELETLGLKEVGQCGFVLVAGGLGERLGYGHIKLRLPTETVTNMCYLELYIQQILAYQHRFGSQVSLPLAIMVSDDTMAGTVELLQEHAYFGMDKQQVHIMKQEKVAALQDSDARFALDPHDKYQILTKPHGHGDVHGLMHRCGVAQKWAQSGIKWVVFMQDTNGLALISLPAALGVSKSLNMEVNSMAIHRVAKQAVGGIARLRHRDGREVTVNVEYNQLDPMLRASGHAEGDTNDPATGFSPYPGNINQLIFALEPYVKVLERTQGVVSEFVNPKYTDATRSTFKSPTRLESMMQDYPKVLGPEANVGFTVAPEWLCFSPVKNNLQDAIKAQAAGLPANSAANGEADMYRVWAKLLQIRGCDVALAPVKSWAGIQTSLGPRTVLHPSFAVCYRDVCDRFKTPTGVKISEESPLVIKGHDVTLEKLTLDGALGVEAQDGASIEIRMAAVQNAGWHLEELAGEELEAAPEELRMRGYQLVKKDQRVIRATKAEGAVVVDDTQQAEGAASGAQAEGGAAGSAQSKDDSGCVLT